MEMKTNSLLHKLLEKNDASPTEEKLDIGTMEQQLKDKEKKEKETQEMIGEMESKIDDILLGKNNNK